MRQLAILVIILFFLILPVSTAFCADANRSVNETSAKELYELQEHCGKRAAEQFEKFYGTGISKDMLVNYTCHYNRKLNKCFLLLTAIGFSERQKGEKDLGVSTDKGLWDINENKQYGQFFTFSKTGLMSQCEVAGKGCRYEAEWDALVRPFMEE